MNIKVLRGKIKISAVNITIPDAKSFFRATAAKINGLGKTGV